MTSLEIGLIVALIVESVALYFVLKVSNDALKAGSKLHCTCIQCELRENRATLKAARQILEERDRDNSNSTG